MDLMIKTSAELKDEIYRLEGLEKQQAIALKARFSSPSAIFSSVTSMFSNTSGTEGTKESGFFKQDFLGLLSRFVLPITLNKTLFKNSNFLIKTLVGVLSQKASNYISEDAAVNVWGHVKSFIDENTSNAPGSLLNKIKSIFDSKKDSVYKIVTRSIPGIKDLPDFFKGLSRGIK